MEVRPIQNPNRYIRTNDGWLVSSISDSPNGNVNGEIRPVTIPKGESIPNSSVYTVLDVDGIVIQIDDKYLISPTTMLAIGVSNNPHWDYQQNGSVMGKRIGSSIPIIRIDVSKLVESGNGQDLRIANAGVESVDYIYETELEMGIPIGLINQLNYTLNESTTRPGDSFSLWDMNLGDDTLYSIQALNITTAQEDGKLDTQKLKEFLSSLGTRLGELRKDFNSIKGTFYNGEPPINKGLIRFTDRVASTESTQDSAPQQRVFKESELIGVGTTPISSEVTASITQTNESDLTQGLGVIIGDLERNRRIAESTDGR